MTDTKLKHEFDGLKQFLSALVAQSEARLETKFNRRFDVLKRDMDETIFRLGTLEHKIDNGFAGIADIQVAQNDRIDKSENQFFALQERLAA